MKRVSKLPAVVPLRPGSTFYSASSIVDLMRLASRLRRLSPIEKCHVAGHLNDQRVMFAPWWLRVAVWLGAKRWGNTSAERWILLYRICHERGTTFADGLIEDTARWMVDGFDREEKTNVGGFSQREINFISGLIDVVPEMLAEVAEKRAFA